MQSPSIDRTALEKTSSLQDAVRLLFNVQMQGRTYLVDKQGMTDGVAAEYDALGKNYRKETYHKIVEDFKRRTGCYGANHPATLFDVGSILEVGCGSGLLTTKIAQQTTSSNVVGIDISEDMITLALANLSKREETMQVLLPSKTRTNQISYIVGSVYNLSSLAKSHALPKINYLVCRNTLHRLEDPKKALEQMYNVLSQNGKIYIRDVKRDAPWQTILWRIGEPRWQTLTLVRDYIAAMASTFTIAELESTLHSLDIKNFEITSGAYVTAITKNQDRTNPFTEYEQETEYVCVIQKKA